MPFPPKQPLTTPLTVDGEADASLFDYTGPEIGKRASLGGFIAISAQLAKLAIQLAGIAILARLLSPSDFGLVAMAATVAGFVSLFGDLGLSTATLRGAALNQRRLSTLFYVGMSVSIVIMAMAILLSPVAAQIFGDSRVAPLCAALALGVPITALGAQHAALLARGMKWITIHSAVLIGQSVGLVAAVVLALQTNASYWSLVAQTVISQSVTSALQWTFCSWRPSFTLDLKGAFKEIRFGAGITGFAITNYFHRQADNVLLGMRWGEQELGYYTRAYQLLMVPTTLVNSAVGSAVIPLLCRYQENHEKWREYFLRSLSLTCFLAYAISCVIVVNAHAIVIVILGDDWRYAGPILLALSLSLFALTPMNAMSWVFISLGRSGDWFRWGLFTSILFPIAYLIGLPYRSVGVAVGYSLMVTALAVPCIAYAVRGSAVTHWDVGRVVRGPLVAAALATFGGSYLRFIWIDLQPVPALILGALVTDSIFFAASLLAVIVDPAQNPQRRFLHSIFSR